MTSTHDRRAGRRVANLLCGRLGDAYQVGVLQSQSRPLGMALIHGFPDVYAALVAGDDPPDVLAHGPKHRVGIAAHPLHVGRSLVRQPYQRVAADGEAAVGDSRQAEEPIEILQRELSGPRLRPVPRHQEDGVVEAEVSEPRDRRRVVTVAVDAEQEIEARLPHVDDGVPERFARWARPARAARRSVACESSPAPRPAPPPRQP